MSTPIPTPTEIALEAEGGVEVIDKHGNARKLTGDKLRILGSETMCAIADKFGGGKLAEMLWDLTEAKCITNGGREIPDNRTRLAAVSLAFAYLIGRPVERQEIISVNLDADSSIGLAERLANSPALLKSLKEVIAKVENAKEDHGGTPLISPPCSPS